MREKLSTLFNIQPGEGPIAALFLSLSFSTGFSIIFLYASSRALFLTHFNARDLGYVYIGAAVMLMAVGVIFRRIEHRLSYKVLMPATMGFLVLSLIAFRVWLWGGNILWATLFLCMWFDVCYLLTNLSFWGLCGRMFHIRQAKRLYGFVGSGYFLAIVPAGFASPVLARWIGTINLLLLCCLGLVASLFLVILINRRIDGNAPSLDLRKRAAGKPGPVPGDRYQSVIHILWALSVIALFLTDAVLSEQAEIHYTNPDALAGFFGRFFAVMAFTVLLLRGLVSGRIIDGLGVVNALYLLPGLLLLLSGWLSLFSFFQWSGALVFWLAVGLRFFDYVLGYSFHRPAFLVLYQPLSPLRRLAVQTSVESLAEPIAILAVGGILLVGRRYFSIDAVNISHMLLGVSALWLVAIFAVRSEYTKALVDAMKKRIFREGETSLGDKLSLSIIAKRLESPHPAEVIFCVEILEKHAPATLQPILVGLLFHPSDLVVLDTLSRIERLRPPSAVEDVLELMETNKDPYVLETALKTYAALAESDALDLLLARLEDQNRKLVLGAIVGLIRYVGIEGVIAAGEKLLDLQRSERDEDRKIVALAVREIGNPGFYRPLLELLRDDSMEVRRAALAAAEKIRNPRLIPGLIFNLDSQEQRGQASRALAAIGERAMPGLASAFGEPDQQKRVLIGIIKAVARIPGEKATEFLASHIFYPDVTIRRHVLGGLQMRGYQAEGEQMEKIRAHILKEVESAAWLFNALNTISGGDLTLLEKALQDEIDGITGRVLAMLSFLYPSSAVLEAQKNLNHPRPEKRAYALETIDSLIGADLKRVVFPLLEDLSPESRFERLRPNFPQEDLTIDRLLIAILERDDALIGSWTKTAALHAMGLMGDPMFGPSAGRAAAAGDPLMRETGEWVLTRTGKGPKEG